MTQLPGSVKNLKTELITYMHLSVGLGLVHACMIVRMYSRFSYIFKWPDFL